MPIIVDIFHSFAIIYIIYGMGLLTVISPTTRALAKETFSQNNIVAQCRCILYTSVSVDCSHLPISAPSSLIAKSDAHQSEIHPRNDSLRHVRIALQSSGIAFLAPPIVAQSAPVTTASLIANQVGRALRGGPPHLPAERGVVAADAPRAHPR